MGAVAKSDPPTSDHGPRQWMQRDALQELGEIIRSCGVSITEAAYRGNDAAAMHHVQEARLTIMAAISCVKALRELAKPLPKVRESGK